MIEYSCTKCRRRLESPNEHAGISVDCPYCQAPLTVPGGDIFSNLDAETEPAPSKSALRESPRREPPRRSAKRDADDVDDIDVDEDAPRTERKPSRKEKKPANAGMILLAGVGVAVVFIGGGILIWQMISSKKTPTTEPEKANVVEAPPAPKDETLSSEEIYKRAVATSAFIVVKLAGPDEARIKMVQGSGNVIDKQRRLVLTAYHVIEGGQEIRVCFPKYKTNGELITDIEEYDPTARDGYPAKVLKSDASKDLAILQVDWIPKESRAIPLAAASPSQGEETHTVGGYPKESLGLWVYSKGNVREVQKSNFTLDNNQKIDSWVVRATNPVNPGDSGGGLINKKCELVGVCCAINRRAAGVMAFIDVREVRTLLEKK